MRLKAFAPALAVTLLVAPATAAAKGIADTSVCGPEGCREVRDRSLMMSLAEGGPPTSPPERRGDFYVIRFEVHAEDARDRFEVSALPEQRMLRGTDGTWMALSSRGAAALARVTRGLERFPAADLPRDPPARVDEVMEPPVATEPSADGSTILVPLGIAGLALAAGAGLVALIRRRRRGSLRARPSQS